MLVFLILAACALAALASWHLAKRQGRSAWQWALWTFLLGGLPLVLLVIHALFAPPRFGSRPPDCCAEQDWTALADLGHAAGADFDLGRCRSCGAHLMAVFYVASTTYVVISKEQAEGFLALQGTPELKKALKAWLD